MPRSIPESKVDEIREATDIVDLVSGYVTLKRSGRNFVGLCPFHAEKTPSFSVNAEKQIFHCFGCGVGGNVYTFLMRHEGTSFPDVAQLLAKRSGIAIDIQQPDEQASRENESLYYINEFAATVYEKSLASEMGAKARTYLEKRGLSDECMTRFGIGYAQPGWDFLTQETANKSYDLELVSTSGLILKKEKGGHYDRFRDRVMFPIKSLSGRVVAFGGRVLQKTDNAPKYINSPESPIYEKGKILYGLYQNRDQIRKRREAVFVEGYMDLLSLVAGGITNVVATLGTALTDNQAHLILRYTKKVVMLYDSDAAGVAATIRGADVLIASDVDVHIADLPEGHDPDTFIRELGSAALMDLIAGAKSLFEYKLSRLTETRPEDRREGIASLLNSLAAMKDRIERSLLVSKAADALEISEKVLWTELESLLHKKRRPRFGGQISRGLGDWSGHRKKSKSEKALEDLIKVAIYEWSLTGLIFANLDLSELTELKMYPIITYMQNYYRGGKRLRDTDLIHRFNEIEMSSFLAGEMHEDLETLDLKRWVSDCILVIKRERIQREIESVREEMRLAQNNGLAVTDFLQKCFDLESAKKELCLIDGVTS